MRKVIYEPKGKAKEYCDLAANLYKGCGHNCLYCYVPQILRMKKEDFRNPVPRKDIIKRLEEDCKDKDLSGESVLLSFTSDPYQPIDKCYKLARKAIALIHSTGANVEILTKGGMRATSDFNFYLKGDKFGTTMTFMDGEKSAIWESGAASPTDRLKAIKVAKYLEIETWLSLEPIIEPNETYRIIEATYEDIDFYKIGKLNYTKTDIDWHKVVTKIIKLMNKYNKRYYIKKDLAKYI